MLIFKISKIQAKNAARRIYPPLPPGKGVYKPQKMTKFFKLVCPPYSPKTTAINNLIRKYFFMKSYLNIIPFIFNVHFWIFHTESLVKMSNSLWFSRIFTLQSSSWFCFNYSFDYFIDAFEKDYFESEKFFYNHWI